MQYEHFYRVWETKHWKYNGPSGILRFRLSQLLSCFQSKTWTQCPLYQLAVLWVWDPLCSKIKLFIDWIFYYDTSWSNSKLITYLVVRINHWREHWRLRPLSIINPVTVWYHSIFWYQIRKVIQHAWNQNINKYKWYK